MGEPPQRPEWVRDLGLFAVIVTEVLVCTGLGLAAGYYLWKRSGFPAWTGPALALAGLAIAMFRLYRYAQRKP